MTTTKSYDYLNRLTAISSTPSAAAVVSFNYSYNQANQRTKDTLVDNSYWNCNYDALGQVTSGHKYFYDHTPVAGQQFDYTFDTIGNRKSTLTGGDQTGANQRTASYTNNTLNQITGRDVPGYIDVKGNSIATNTVTVGGQPAYRKWEYFRDELPVNNSSAALWSNIVVTATGQTSVTGNVYVAKAPETFTYDLDGNLTGDGRWTYSWDAENRLTNMVSLSSAPTGSKFNLAFAYDAQGRRIQKIVSTNNGSAYVGQYTNKYVYDGWNLIAILNPQSSILQSFVWGTDLSGSGQGAGGVGGLLETANYGVSTNFVAYDGNGNVAALIRASDGTNTATYEYGPFGEVVRATGLTAKANPFRFSTKYQDDESDLLYYGYRFYNQSQGRWLSRDPIEERGGVNIYAFVKNNPRGRADTFGREDFDVVGKSFINGVGEPGHLSRFGLDLGLPFSVWPWYADTRLRLYALLAGTLPAFNQNPADDAKVGDYRLYAKTKIHVDCKGNMLGNFSASQPDMAGGSELILPIPPNYDLITISGTINSIVTIPQRTSSSATVVMRTWGHPNVLAEPGMQWVGFRTSVNIWQEAKIEFSCCSGVASANLLSFNGSKYPSRRLWVNGDRKAFFDQGPLSSLWHADPNNLFFVAP